MTQAVQKVLVPAHGAGQLTEAEVFASLMRDHPNQTINWYMVAMMLVYLAKRQVDVHDKTKLMKMLDTEAVLQPVRHLLAYTTTQHKLPTWVAHNPVRMTSTEQRERINRIREDLAIPVSEDIEPTVQSMIAMCSGGGLKKILMSAKTGILNALMVGEKVEAQRVQIAHIEREAERVQRQLKAEVAQAVAERESHRAAREGVIESFIAARSAPVTRNLPV